MIADAVVIRRVAEPFGFLGNMSPHPVTLRHAHGDLTFRTAEALFQAWRFVGDVRRWPTDEEIAAWAAGADPTRWPESDAPCCGYARAVFNVAIRTSPMSAKMAAKNLVDLAIVAPRSARDVENMRRVISLKVAQHPFIADQLRATGDRWIVEDCSARPSTSGLFWGARRVGEMKGVGTTWEGKNALGNLWMSVRGELAP